MSTRRDSWRSILDTRNDVDRMVAAAVGDYPNQIPVRPSGAGGGRLHGSAMGPEPESVPFQEPTWQATLGDTTQVTPSPTAKDGAADGAAAREINEQELQVLRDLQVGVSKRLDGLSAALAQELGRDDAMK
ncbi:MAG: hypothetical protein K0V04_00320, partial [Deltaproteobacteria bacterium]|nr:hypothetical protein [Deltaproteobacteria bacterium]